MARVTLYVPTNKMQSFLHAVLKLGLDKHAILLKNIGKQHPAKKPAEILDKIAKSFILFDWEFFSNELEYE